MTKEEKIKEVENAMKNGYELAISECKFGASLYITGFIDGMQYQKDGTIPESLMSKALRELEENKQN